MRRSSLTGSWSGAYRYPDDAFPETVFSAGIWERDGAFTGRTQEPDILRPWTGGIVTAAIDGVRHGCEVNFIKCMDGSGGMRHEILYEGAADDSLNRIEGVWCIPGEWSGTFFMQRDDDGEEETAGLKAEARS